MHFDGNVLSIEPVEEAERCIAVVDKLIELEAVGIPYELWHDVGIKFVVSRFGDVCSVVQYFLQGDYTSVRALVMVAIGLQTPESMTIRLPISHEVKSVALKVMQQWTHDVDANPFAGSSEESISTGSSNSGSSTTGGWARPDTAYPPAPPPSPTPTSPPTTTVTDDLVINTSSLTPAHVDVDFSARAPIFAPAPTRPATSLGMSPLLKPSPPTRAIFTSVTTTTGTSAMSGLTTLSNAASPSARGSAFVPFAPTSTFVSLEPKSNAFTFEASSSRGNSPPALVETNTRNHSLFSLAANSVPNLSLTPTPSLPVNDLETHELHINKASVVAKRARRYADKAKRSAELMRRSDHLARKEPRVYTSMVTRASNVKASRLGDDGSASTFLDALHASGLDDPAVPPAPPAALALLAMLYGADKEQVNTVRNTDD
ncbi:hypothetical protein ZWY2020_025455 [Hordeum vulgare]|nr:hypothetical protein ZWY2020_025455 [Hordeum vulgare]